MKKITKEDFKKAVHPKQNARYILALVICIPVLIISLILTYVSSGMILVAIGFLFFLIWFSLKILETIMIANSVQVSELNFHQVHQMCEEIKTSMGYKKEIRIFITSEGGFNASLAKFFRVKFIILTSSLLEDMSKEGNTVQLKWIIARFIASLETKQKNLHFLATLIESLDSIKIFGLFILPYERKTQYTGDNMGLLYCEDLEQVLIAFDKFMIGSKLSEKVNFEGLVQQGNEVSYTFFSLLARIGSSHPHYIDRHLNLLAFAKKELPEQYEKYIAKHSQQKLLNFEKLLPKY